MNQKKINFYTTLVYLTCFFMCMSMNVTGPVLNDVMIHYSLPLSNGGLMTLFQYLGGVIAIAVASVFLNRSNKGLAFLIPLIVMGVSAMFIGLAPAFPLFMLSYLVLGMGLTSCDVIANALIPDLQYQRKNKAVCFLHGVTGIGAILIAFVSGIILDSGTEWNFLYRMVSIIMFSLSLLMACSYFAFKKDVRPLVAPPAEAKEPGAVKRFLTDRKVWLTMLILFFFGSTQSTILVWSVQYVRDTYQAPSLESNLAIAFYWAGTSVVRMLFGVTRLSRWNVKKVSIIGSITAGLALLAGLLFHQYLITLFSIFIFGALNAPVLPLMATRMNLLHKESSGLAASATFIAMYTAFAIAPFFVGFPAAAFGMDSIMIIAAAATILAGICSFAIKED